MSSAIATNDRSLKVSEMRVMPNIVIMFPTLEGIVSKLVSKVLNLMQILEFNIRQKN